MMRFATLAECPAFRGPTLSSGGNLMKVNYKLGLTMVAAALLAVYGCSKEEPKQAAAGAGGHGGMGGMY